MGFSSRLKAHRHLLTLETLKFIVEFAADGNAKLAAIRSGIPDTYATRQAQWLKKLPVVKQALETQLDDRDLRQLNKAMRDIEAQIDVCKKILNIEEY
ncbi:MAG: hypothetical protein AABZ31_12775 [Bdellovibrionota bacterium]